MSFTVQKLSDQISIQHIRQLNGDDLSTVTPNSISSILRSKFSDTWKPTPCVLTSDWNNVGEAIKKFKVFEDDVWLLSWLKSGTTWSQEMVWLICNNLDYEGAKLNITHRFPFIEHEAVRPKIAKFNPLRIATAMNRPRFIKSHLPVTLLPDEIWTKKPKMVYVTRNIKDVAISYYHHSITLHEFSGTFDDFMEAFISDRTFYSPYYEHNADFFTIRSEPNILFLTYEEMKKDLKSVVLRAIKFFNRQYTDNEINTLIQHLSFESMKNNKSTNYDDIIDQIYASRRLTRPENANFIRKGIVGNWKSELPARYADALDQMILDKCHDRELLSILTNNS